MSCSATAFRCALLAPTRWSMHAFLFLSPVSFRAWVRPLCFRPVSVQFRVTICSSAPSCSSRSRLLSRSRRCFSVVLAVTPFSLRRLFGFARYGLLGCLALVSRGPLLFLFSEASSSFVTLLQARTVSTSTHEILYSFKAYLQGILCIALSACCHVSSRLTYVIARLV